MCKFYKHIILALTLLITTASHSQNCVTKFDSTCQQEIYTNVDTPAQFPGDEAIRVTLLSSPWQPARCGKKAVTSHASVVISCIRLENDL